MTEFPGNRPLSTDESGSENGLTPIHRRIHCPATNETCDGQGELRANEIYHFIDTLAEIALAISRRKVELDR